MPSQPAKSTNPFDMAFESDVEASNMVCINYTMMWFVVMIIIIWILAFF